jgi:hypothetical protein
MMATQTDTSDPNTSAFDVQFSEPIGVGFGSNGSISCVVFYEGANFDNNPASNYPGEWNMGTGLTCPGGSDPSRTPELDVTRIIPLESQAPNMPVTGFSSRWRINYDNKTNGGCMPGVSKGTMTAPGPCSPPVAWGTVHFVFSKQSGPTTIKRADGTPVPDDSATLAVTIPM